MFLIFDFQYRTLRLVQERKLVLYFQLAGIFEVEYNIQIALILIIHILVQKKRIDLSQLFHFISFFLSNLFGIIYSYNFCTVFKSLLKSITTKTKQKKRICIDSFLYGLQNLIIRYV